MVQLGQTAAARQVGGDCERRLAAEDVFDEAGQVAAGPDIDEQAKAVRMHGLDRLAEGDGCRPLLGRPGRESRSGHRASAGAMRRNRSERCGGLKVMPSKKSAIGATTGCEARRVIGARERQIFPEDALLRGGGRPVGSNSSVGTARTTWWGQLSMATAAPSAADGAADGFDALSIGGDGDQVGLGQITG